MFEDADYIFYPRITREQFEALRAETRAKRICFQTTHAGEPKRGVSIYTGTLNVPFTETIKHVFESECGLRLFRNDNERAAY